MSTPLATIMMRPILQSRFKIDVNNDNWENYEDGWSIYTDIVYEAMR